MDTNLISLLVAVVSIVVPIVLWRWSHPRKVLTLSTVTNHVSSAGSDVDVTYQGEDIENAYIVEVVVTNTDGPDIPSSAFDAGKPLCLHLRVPILEEVSTNHAYQIGEDGESLFFEPQLIRKYRSIRGLFLCNGSPDITIDSPLIDVDWNVLPPGGRAKFKWERQTDWVIRGQWIYFWAFAFAFVTFIALAIFRDWGWLDNSPIGDWAIWSWLENNPAGEWLDRLLSRGPAAGP